MPIMNYSKQMTKYEPPLRNGLESPDYDEMLAAYLTLVDQHCLHLVPVPASSSVPRGRRRKGQKARFSTSIGSPGAPWPL